MHILHALVFSCKHQLIMPMKNHIMIIPQLRFTHGFIKYAILFYVCTFKHAHIYTYINMYIYMPKIYRMLQLKQARCWSKHDIICMQLPVPIKTLHATIMTLTIWSLLTSRTFSASKYTSCVRWWDYTDFCALLVLYQGNPSGTGGFPSQWISNKELWFF